MADADAEADAGLRSATPDSGSGAGAARLVWMGAHPDDELYAAPWLAARCLDGKLSCTFVVLTMGEAGRCKLPAGCRPDLKTLRMHEMRASAALFGATLVQWDLGDGRGADVRTVLERWNSRRGGTLIADVARLLEGADIIVSFDPRHGESCHPDHRAAGALAVLARRTLGSAPFVTMVASKGVVAPAAPGDTSVVAFDASATLPTLGTPAWSFLPRTMQTHASQFLAEEVAQVAAIPPALQRTYLLSEADVVDPDPRYEGVCP